MFRKNSRHLQHEPRIESCRIVCRIYKNYDPSYNNSCIAYSSFDTRRLSYSSVVYSLIFSSKQFFIMINVILFELSLVSERERECMCVCVCVCVLIDSLFKWFGDVQIICFSDPHFPPPPVWTYLKYFHNLLFFKPSMLWNVKWCMKPLNVKSLLWWIYAEVESLRARFPGIWTGPP